jgi:hypothetical protein
MVQRSQGARLAAQASQALRLACELSGQALDGNVATELAIVCATDLAHATSAKWRHDPIRSELPAQKVPGSRPGDRHIAHCRLFEETAGLFVLRKQPLDMLPQVCVSAACNVEECLARFRHTVQSRVEEPLYSSPTFLVHGKYRLCCLTMLLHRR